MQFGETRVFGHSITADAPFQITAATYQFLTAAGAAVPDGSGAATIVEAGTANQEVRAAFTPPAAGEYKLVFTVSVGGQVQFFEQFITVDPAPEATRSYPGIVERIRSRLRDAADGLPDATFTKDIELELLLRFGPYAPRTYTDLSGDDLKFANTAIGFAVAVKQNVPLQTGGFGNAPLVYRNITTPDNSRITQQTAQISAGSNIDERTVWSQESNEAWSQISFVAEGREQAALEAAASVRLAGRRRALERTARPWQVR